MMLDAEIIVEIYFDRKWLTILNPPPHVHYLGLQRQHFQFCAFNCTYSEFPAGGSRNKEAPEALRFTRLRSCQMIIRSLLPFVCVCVCVFFGGREVGIGSYQ